MTLKIFCFKNDKNLVIFDLSTSKSPKLALPFTPIVQSINVWPKKYSGVIFHDTEGWCKIWRKIDLWIAKLTWGIWQILTWALESLKKFHFNVLLLSKVYILWAKKSTNELSFMKLKRDTKFGEKSTCHFKISIRSLTDFNLSAQSLKNSLINELLLSKVYIVWAKKVQRSFPSWNQNGIQNLEGNQLVVSKLT